MQRSIAFGQALVWTFVCAFAESCLHGPCILLLTVIAIEDYNRTQGILIVQGSLWGLSRRIAGELPVGHNYIRKHVVSPFAGELSGYDLPPLKVFVESPIGLV